MECGVNYHRLIKGTEQEWMSFVLPAVDSTAASQVIILGTFLGNFKVGGWFLQRWVSQ